MPGGGGEGLSKRETAGVHTKCSRGGAASRQVSSRLSVTPEPPGGSLGGRLPCREGGLRSRAPFSQGSPGSGGGPVPTLPSGTGPGILAQRGRGCEGGRPGGRVHRGAPDPARGNLRRLPRGGAGLGERVRAHPPAAHFRPSFQGLPREDFPRSEIPAPATVTFLRDAGWGRIWPQSPFPRLGGGVAEAVRAGEGPAQPRAQQGAKHLNQAHGLEAIGA